MSLTELELETVGRGRNAYIAPQFLDEKHLSQVRELIAFLDENVNKKRKEINFEEILVIFDSKKIAKGLITSLSRFYRFVSISIREIIGEDRAENKRKTTDLKQFLEEAIEKEENVKYMKASELRAKVLDEVNKRYPGYVPPEEREKFVKDVEKKFELPFGALDYIFFSDLESDKVLIKEKTVSPNEAIRYYNYDVIETVLSYSRTVEVMAFDLPGYVLKNLIFLSKVNYIFTDIKKLSEKYAITIEPPIELFQEKSKWGGNIANVITYFLKNALKLKLKFKITAVIQYRNRNLLFTLDSALLPMLPFEYILDEEIEEKGEIDSKIEAEFMYNWKNMHGWQATAEKEPIIIEKEVIVPDFVLTRGKTKVFIEIVGYYTQKYIQKKKKKMKLLTQKNIPIIYLIDEELRPNFTDMRDITAIYYSKNKVPSKELLKLLETEYGDFAERLPAMLEELCSACHEVNENDIPLSLKQLREKLGAYSENELKKVLSTAEAKKIINENNIKFIPSFGFVSKNSIKKVKKYMIENKRVKYQEIRDNFPQIGEALIPICQLIGCKIRWKTFEEIEIYFKTTK